MILRWTQSDTMYCVPTAGVVFSIYGFCEVMGGRFSGVSFVWISVFGGCLFDCVGF